MPTYYCSVHGEVRDVMLHAFDSTVLRDPDTNATMRIERLYCTACYCAFMDQQVGQVVEVVKDEAIATD